MGGGRVVRASGSETIVLSSMPTSAIIYDAYTFTITKKLKKKKQKKTSVSSSTPTNAIVYDAYTSLIKNKTNNKKKWVRRLLVSLCMKQSFRVRRLLAPLSMMDKLL